MNVDREPIDHAAHADVALPAGVLRCMVHNGDAHYVVVRGGPVFEAWSAEGLPVRVGARVKVAPGPVLLVLSLPGTTELADLVRLVAARPDTAVVVDVVFPLWRPDLMTGGQVAVEFWSRPEVVAAAEEAIRAADAVTTSFPTWGPQDGSDAEPCLSWLDDLRRLNPVVHVLPCLGEELFVARSPDGRRVGFGEQLELIWADCLRRKAVDRCGDRRGGAGGVRLVPRRGCSGWEAAVSGALRSALPVRICRAVGPPRTLWGRRTYLVCSLPTGHRGDHCDQWITGLSAGNWWPQ